MSDKCGGQNITTLNKYGKDNPIINGQSMQVYHTIQRNGQMKLYIREDQIKTATKQHKCGCKEPVVELERNTKISISNPKVYQILNAKCVSM